MTGGTRRVVAVFALALVARLVAAAWLAGEIDWNAGDLREYDQAARADGWIADIDTWAAREPGYPLFLRAAYAMPGSDEVGVLVLQAFKGSLGVALTLIGLRGIFPGRIGLAAAVWMAVAPDLVWIAVRPLRAGLVFPLLVVHVVWFLRAMSGRGRRALVVSGVAAVALVHTDARFLVTVAALPLAALAFAGRKEALRRAG